MNVNGYTYYLSQGIREICMLGKKGWCMEKWGYHVVYMFLVRNQFIDYFCGVLRHPHKSQTHSPRRFILTMQIVVGEMEHDLLDNGCDHSSRWTTYAYMFIVLILLFNACSSQVLQMREELTFTLMNWAWVYIKSVRKIRCHPNRFWLMQILWR